MILEPPKTLEEFEQVRKTILELMANPWCDQYMLLTLEKKLEKVNAKIEELKSNSSEA